MTTRDNFGRDLSRWLSEDAQHRVPDHLTEVLVQTAATRQRPWWSSPERWLPVQTTLRLAPVPRVPVLLLVTAALVVAIAAAAVFVGSKPRPAPIVGIAQNGPVIYSEDGDLFRFDPATGESVAVVRGPENDVGPQFSRDGLSFVFARLTSPTTRTMFVADADGSNVRQVAVPLPDVKWVDWSPDGSQLALVTPSAYGTIMIANADGSGSRRLVAGGDDIDQIDDFALWVGPSGDELLFRGIQAGVAGLYTMPADGSAEPRLITAQLPSTADTFQHPTVTLDGRSVAWDSFEQSAWQPAVGERTAGWDGMLQQIHVQNLVTGKDVVIPPPTDPLVSSQPVDSYAPIFSPDGSQIVFLRDRSDGQMELGVAPADGTDPGQSLGLLKAWGGEWPSFGFTPDGTQVIVAYADENVAHLLPLDGSAGTTIPKDEAGIPSMQRLAP
jgi:Tol biopolymer transport system component